jgi:hypothetical protein
VVLMLPSSGIVPCSSYVPLAARWFLAQINYIHLQGKNSSEQYEFSEKKLHPSSG